MFFEEGKVRVQSRVVEEGRGGRKSPQQWDDGATDIRRVGWGRGHALGLKREPLVASTARLRDFRRRRYS